MKVSVAMITYNHERFIAQAIESILMQQVNFDYELIIGEDCSTDKTREIVIDYQKRHPDKIRLLLPPKNLGGHENDKQTSKACRGDYIAVLEGDDYWISPYKLQKQVDFLDNHPDCTICFHSATTLHEGEQEPRGCFPVNQKQFSTLEDLLVKNFIPNCTTMYRRGLFDEVPDSFYTLLMGDWPHHILNAQHGRIGYINEVMSVYRVHQGGISSTLTPAQTLRADIEFYDVINVYLDFKYEQLIRTRISERWDELAGQLIEEAIAQGAVQAAIQHINKQFDHWPDKLPLSNAWKAQTLSKIYAQFGFDSYSKHDLGTARYCWLRAIRHNPSWLRNRGVWSICVGAYLSPRIVGWLR